MTGITFSYGEIRVNGILELLNNEGEVMPNLWGIGEFSGGLFTFNYPGGSGLVKGAVFGIMAGYAASMRAADGSINPNKIQVNGNAKIGGLVGEDRRA